MKKIIISGDPGLTYFGFCVVEYEKKKPKILEAYLWDKPIRSLIRENTIKKVGPKRKRQKIEIEGNYKSTKRFVKRMSKVFDKYKPDEVVFERFMQRGFVGGQAISECVSFMLGCIATICVKKKISFTFIPSAQWKNNINKYTSLDNIYSKLKKEKVLPHCFDAFCQGIYRAQQLGLYSYEKLAKQENKIIKHFISVVKNEKPKNETRKKVRKKA